MVLTTLVDLFCSSTEMLRVLCLRTNRPPSHLSPRNRQPSRISASLIYVHLTLAHWTA